MQSKTFKQRSSVKFQRPNPVRDFFLAQAIEWHEEGFTSKRMAQELMKWGFYPEWEIKNVMTRMTPYLHRYCRELPKKSVLQPAYPKWYKLKTEYI